MFWSVGAVTVCLVDVGTGRFRQSRYGLFGFDAASKGQEWQSRHAQERFVLTGLCKERQSGLV